MSNPIEAFREQRAVAGEVYATLKDVGALLSSLKEQADGLVPIDELRELLEQERAWLQEAQRTLSQVRAFARTSCAALERVASLNGRQRSRLRWPPPSPLEPATPGRLSRTRRSCQRYAPGRNSLN